MISPYFGRSSELHELLPLVTWPGLSHVTTEEPSKHITWSILWKSSCSFFTGKMSLFYETRSHCCFYQRPCLWNVFQKTFTLTLGASNPSRGVAPSEAGSTELVTVEQEKEQNQQECLIERLVIAAPAPMRSLTSSFRGILECPDRINDRSFLFILALDQTLLQRLCEDVMPLVLILTLYHKTLSLLHETECPRWYWISYSARVLAVHSRSLWSKHHVTHWQ